MGISSVTEAPRWRHDAAATRCEIRRVPRAPERLTLVSADAAQLVFAGRRPVLAPFFLSPLAFALAALPWLGPAPMTALRVGTSALFIGVTAALAVWGWPRRREVRLSRARAPGAEQPPALRWILDVAPEPSGHAALYTLEYLPEGGDAQTVLQSSDPERLSWQLSEVLRHWPAPVECRWGLGAAARPWHVEPHSGPRQRADAPDVSVIAVPLAHAPLVWCTRIMAGFVVLDLVFLMTTAGATVPVIHPLSIVLPIAFAIYLISLALATATGSTRLHVGPRVRRETSILGVVACGTEVRLESVRAVHVLGLPGAERWHVLLDSADGPLAIAVPREEATALARDVERALQAARASA